MKLIVAMSENRVIGKEGKIPWKCKAEMKLFKGLTIENNILMGRKTWESLPIKPLKDRYNIVLSRSCSIDEGEFCCLNGSTEFIRDLDEIEGIWDDVICIGGEAVYKEVLKRGLVNDIYMSVMKKSYDGDVYFPELDKSKWWEVTRTDYEEFEWRWLKRC